MTTLPLVIMGGILAFAWRLWWASAALLVFSLVIPSRVVPSSSLFFTLLGGPKLVNATPTGGYFWLLMLIVLSWPLIGLAGRYLTYGLPSAITAGYSRYQWMLSWGILSTLLSLIEVMVVVLIIVGLSLVLGVKIPTLSSIAGTTLLWVFGLTVVSWMAMVGSQVRLWSSVILAFIVALGLAALRNIGGRWMFGRQWMFYSVIHQPNRVLFSVIYLLVVLAVLIGLATCFAEKRR